MNPFCNTLLFDIGIIPIDGKILPMECIPQAGRFLAVRRRSCENPLWFWATVERRSGGPSVDLVSCAAKDPSQRIVITGMGICSVFGNDVDTFYDKLLAGESGIDMIDRFDTTEFPTKFAGQIKNFDSEGLIDKKSERRYDDCLKYSMVRDCSRVLFVQMEKNDPTIEFR
eukprot:5017083-Pyramimonas_sp.AAC.2